MRSAEPMHAAESHHSTEAARTSAWERAAAKACSDWRTEMVVIELTEMIEVVKTM